jgi:hypothetical protein
MAGASGKWKRFEDCFSMEELGGNFTEALKKYIFKYLNNKVIKNLRTSAHTENLSAHTESIE